MDQGPSDRGFVARSGEMEPVERNNGRDAEHAAPDDHGELQRERAYQRETILDLIKVFCWLLVLTLISLAAFMVFGLR